MSARGEVPLCMTAWVEKQIESLDCLENFPTISACGMTEGRRKQKGSVLDLIVDLWRRSPGGLFQQRQKVKVWGCFEKRPAWSKKYKGCTHIKPSRRLDDVTLWHIFKNNTVCPCNAAGPRSDLNTTLWGVFMASRWDGAQTKSQIYPFFTFFELGVMWPGL